MTSINAGGAFYRVQNSLNQNSEEVSKSMQRLASGKQNIAPGDRTASSAVAWGMKAEAASLKIGMQNGTEALQAVEMVNNDIQALNDIVVRLEELHALGTNGFNTTEDTAALTAEASKLIAEMVRIVDDAQWKGNVIANSTSNANDVSFGRNTAALDITLADLTFPEVPMGFKGDGGTEDLAMAGYVTADTESADTTLNAYRALSAGDAFYNDDLKAPKTWATGDVGFDSSIHTNAETLKPKTLGYTVNNEIANGSTYAAFALLGLKQNVDTMSIEAGALYNQVSNTLSHLGSLNAGYSLDVASKMDVDFAGETTELAKGQILAQAGTAMLAQANAQGQGMLALLQS
ncbi:flagellin [Planktomarina temperata]|nr:flagellin [Planktomarina temperata]